MVELRISEVGFKCVPTKDTVESQPGIVKAGQNKSDRVDSGAGVLAIAVVVARESKFLVICQGCQTAKGDSMKLQ